MSYRICIPCAGTGSRLGRLTSYLNKSLVSVGNKPALSHIIDHFPIDTEFVIPLGHKGHLIREFVSIVYPKRKFYFVDVNPYEGEGSGLGHSIKTCKSYLQEPFIFTACDTLVKESVPEPTCNWMGYADIRHSKQYKTITIESGLVTSINKESDEVGTNSRPYIGLAGIHNYEEFWSAMDIGGANAIQAGEAYGFCSLIQLCTKAICFTWFDIGNPDALAKTKQYYSDTEQPCILEKSNEAIWFVGSSVVKYSDDKNFIANRVSRAALLTNYVPELHSQCEHMYAYFKVDGQIFSDVVTLKLFDLLLQHCESFWNFHKLDSTEMHIFKKTCISFYRDKTYERVSRFYQQLGYSDEAIPINGADMPKLETLLKSLDWNWLADGVPCQFHGDFHFENILYIHSKQNFVFIDWRQDFGGSLTTGDIYYDFAKLLHGLILSHKLILNNAYSIDWSSESINFDFQRRHVLVECETRFKSWLAKNKYDCSKVYALTSIIFLNIAVLHHYPYNLLLYALGKSMLSDLLK